MRSSGFSVKLERSTSTVAREISELKLPVIKEENVAKVMSGKGEVGGVGTDADTDGIKARRTKAKPKTEHIEQDSIDKPKITDEKKLQKRV